MTERRLGLLALALGVAVLTSNPATAADNLPPGPAAAAARLSPDSVSAAADAQALLTVDAPGRFSIRAESRTGVALQLVDMIAGPGEVSGETGARDGRIDALLDKGTYKIRTFASAGTAGPAQAAGPTQAARPATTAGPAGEARLTAKPFHEADAASAALLRGGELSGELKDLEQRSYWILMDKSGSIFVEAAGRALADLRVWRNGTDLVDINPAIATIEPSRGHPLLRARLEGSVEPGLYLATAYGGEALPWADGDKAQPFHMRAGPAATLAGSAAEGVIGPFGSVRFRVPAAPAAPLAGGVLGAKPDLFGGSFPAPTPLAQTYVRLELPDPAPARLSVARSGATPAASAEIAKNSRAPVAAVYAPGRPNDPVDIEVSGQEGQAFRLRVLRPTAPLRFQGAGPHLVAVDVAGEGGDELTAGTILVRFDPPNRAVILTSTAPQVGAGQAWRRKFNLRGPTEILFEVATAGPLAARSEGPGVTVSLEPLLNGIPAPRADGHLAQTFDVEPGWYRLKLAPVDGAVGILDLTFGPPDLRPELAPPSRSRTAIPLGVLDLDRTAHYQVFTDVAPGLVTGLNAHALPADLATAPLALVQADRAGPDSAGALDIPVRVPAGGTITATDGSGHPVAVTQSDEAAAPNGAPNGGPNGAPDGRSMTLHIPAADRPRELVLSWSNGAPPEPVPPVTAETFEALQAAKPHFLDLKQDQQRSFRLEVRDGGLYRIETLGRLKTSTTVATAFLPRLDTASDNGAGHNALLQTYLRAGAYRVSVRASDSAGHLGVVANPAPLAAGAPLLVDGSARASLAQGRGATFAIDIAEAGLYRLDLYGLGRTPTARLEDSEGWPLTVPGELSRLDQRFAPGRYRLVVLPQSVDTRVVARLRRLADPVAPPPAEPLAALAHGHGPHPLVFDAVQKFQWREPAGKDAERIPDRWEFELKGEAHIALDVSDGMIADLIRTDGEARSVAKLAYTRGFSGPLPAGRYALEARALGRNDRLDYELTLRSTELQPKSPRFVDLPATIPFAIAEDRVVSLTTFGRSELAGVLKDQNGHVIERLGARTDDWNIALSRRLPAGAYQLELTKVAATIAAAADNKAPDNETAAPAQEESDQEGNPDTAPNAETGIEVHLDLPDTTQVHEVPLPAGAAGGSGAAAGLLLVAAESSSELVVSLERQETDQHWRPIGFERGRSPVIAAPQDGDTTRPWRAAVWSIDGGSAPIAIVARNVSPPAQPLGNVALAPLELEGITLPVQVAQVTTPSGALVSLAHAAPDLRQGSAPGRTLSATVGGLIAPQSERLWLIGRGREPQSLTLQAVPAVSGEIALSLGEGDKATMKSGVNAPGSLRVWRADSTFGQPGLSGGQRMGVADASAFAIGTPETASVWNAGGSEPIQVHITVADLKARPLVTIDRQFISVLAPRTAHRLILPAGAKQLEIDLAAGAAAVAGGPLDANPITVWGGREAVSRQIAGTFRELLLLNPGDQPAPVSFTLAPAPSDGAAPATGRLATGQVMKRFFGAAGSVSLLVDATPGDRLTVAGATAIFVDDHGAVQRGTSMVVSGPGELILDHPAGLVAAWVEREGKSPWPDAPSVALAAPQSVKLSGEAMTFAIRQDTPVLLHARTTAPVILALDFGQGTGPLPGSEPLLFAAGAELHRYVPAGTATLRLYSPHDGPLAGSLELTATPVTQLAEGLGDPLALAPGATALFSFELTRAGNIGVGVRSEPDRAAVRLLDAAGRSLGEGIAQLHRLEPGRYLVEARVPADGRPVIVRPALIGIAPRPSGPPPEIARQYLETVGLTPNAVRPAVAGQPGNAK